MKSLKLIFLLLAAVASASAQTYRQRGVVRMITTSASSPIIPVAGVKVVVGNTQSKATSADGTFTMQVPGQFQVNGVTPDDEYILALPTKGKTYHQSPNDLDVVVTTKAQKEADYKKLYTKLKRKFRQQTRELDDLRQEYKDLCEEDRTNEEYKTKFDSLQALYLNYINNEQKIEDEIKKIADDLAMTDFLSLDSIERRIYELKLNGEWRSITDLTQEVMCGDAAAFLQAGIALERQKQQELKQAQLGKASRFKIMENAIEALLMQHLNDSVSKYLAILTDAAPDNWTYLNAAGSFEDSYMANFSKSIGYHQRAIAITSVDTLLATSYNAIGAVYVSMGDYDNALEQLEKALNIRLSAFGENHPDVATTYNNIGVVYKHRGNYAKARELYERALRINISVFGENHPRVASSIHNLGVAYYELGDYSRALEQYEKALNILLPNFGDEHPGVFSIYNSLGTVYCALGKYAKALEYLKMALKAQLQVLGDAHPYVALLYSNMGLVCYNNRDYAQALEYTEKALRINLSVFGVNHPDVAINYNSIGLLLASTGDYANALEQHKMALEIQLPILGNNHHDVALSYGNIGNMYYMLGDYNNALLNYENALKIQLATIGENHPEVAMSYNGLGGVYAAMGNYDKALETYDKALLILQNLLPENHQNIQTIKMNIEFVRSKLTERKTNIEE